jgi:hypothetical protein
VISSEETNEDDSSFLKGHNFLYIILSSSIAMMVSDRFLSSTGDHIQEA